MGSLLLAARDTLIDNTSMTDGSSATRLGYRTIIQQIEYRLISLGMSVIAYLLERAVLRSIKNGEAKP